MLHSEGQRKPWKKVALAVFLCVAGAAMLAAGLGVWYSQPKPNPGKARHCDGTVLDQGAVSCTSTVHCTRGA